MTTGFKTSGGCYLDLITNFPPRIVRTEEEFLATQNQIYNILDKEKINKDEQDYLNLLGVILYEYEEDSEVIPLMSSNELLRLLLEESNIEEEKLLNIFPDQQYLSDVLEGKCNISKEQKTELAKLFKLSPTFFDQQLN